MTKQNECAKFPGYGFMLRSLHGAEFTRQRLGAEEVSPAMFHEMA